MDYRNKKDRCKKKIIDKIYNEMNFSKKNNFNIILEEVLKYTNLIDYIYKNYDNLIFYLQYQIIKKISDLFNEDNIRK
jgi:hypothetical protein